MVETTKQVRVDNWGIYFLQRLQLFFSKTDFCDLTLQFEGNVQLKVHRLVMNACTEYFAFLEQTCPSSEENTITMPSHLQADVIVPIVNFMYTGMLEFHPSIYEKLYMAAKIMNIAVLTKLLEAQKPPLIVSRSFTRPKRDFVSSLSLPSVKKTTVSASSPIGDTLAKQKPTWKRRQTVGTVQSHPASATFTPTKWNCEPLERESASSSDSAPKPTRFEWPEEELNPLSTMYPSFDEVSLTSKPLWTKEDDEKAAPTEEQKLQETSASNNASIDGDDEPMDQKTDIVHVEEKLSIANSLKRKSENDLTSSPKRVKITSTDDETVISITTSNPNDIDHTKIVTEILKKYPELVKKRKNIKLKITQAKKEPLTEVKTQSVREKPKDAGLEKSTHNPSVVYKEIKKEVHQLPKDSSHTKEAPLHKKNLRKTAFKADSDDGPWTCLECANNDRDGSQFVLYYLFRKHMADQHQMEFEATLCKYCGKNCPNKTFMTYHLYTKHSLKPPRDVVFPKCTVCPFIAATVDRLDKHLRTHGPDETQCKTCQLGFLSRKDLLNHQQITGHNNRSSSILNCAYCLKKHQSPVILFSHVRSLHMKEARRDGIASLDEVMDIQEEDIEDGSQNDEEIVPENKQRVEEVAEAKPKERSYAKEKVKILSNVKVSQHSEGATRVHSQDGNKVVKIGSDVAPVAVTTSATTLSNIGGSIATDLGLVDIVVLDNNQQYIIQQPRNETGNAEFILPPELAGDSGILQAAAAASGELNSTDELVMVLTDHEYPDEHSQGQSDNSNIVVLYSHPVEGQQGQYITSQGDLLVNSEGVLEIRNGASITTTAGQILVNTDTTTTTQAVDSPIESIDLIRKEIEGASTVDEVKEGSGQGGFTTEAEGKDAGQTETESVVAEQTVPETENVRIKADDNVKAASEDNTDSYQQEESMEVDDVSTIDQHTSQEIIQDAALENEIAAESRSMPLMDTSDLNEMPDTNSEPSTSGLNKFEESTERTERMDVEPEEVNPQQQQQQQQQAPPASVEPSVDEVDHVSETVPTEIPSESFENRTDDGDDEAENIDKQTKVIEPLSSEDNRNQQVSETDLKSVKEAAEEGDRGGDEKEPNAENGQDDTNKNVPISYLDFGNDSDPNACNKSKEIDKEILEDWDDTDSQQSQSHEREAQDQAAEKGSENVNKLMHDWEDEEDDQTKG